MAKDYKISVRVALAFAVAAVADALQFGMMWLSGHWTWLTDYLTLPGEITDIGLDLIVGVILALLLGFHPILLPSFLVKVVQIPAVEELPTWTACVTYLVWSKKRKAADGPQQADTEDPPQTPDEPQPAPRKAPAAKMYATTPSGETNGSRIWYMAAIVAIVAGLIWFKHRHASFDMPAFNPEPTALAAPAAPVSAPALAPIQYTGTDPVVVVAPIENQSTNSEAGKDAGRLKSFLEDTVRGIGGVKLLGGNQAQSVLAQWQNQSGVPASVFVVVGTILDLHDAKGSFNGYGVAEKTLDTECEMRVQVIQAADGSVAYSKILDGSKLLEETQYSQSAPDRDRSFLAMKSAVKKLEKDADFKTAFHGGSH